MAACDNLYGNKEEWQELHDFLIANKKKTWIKRYMKPQPEDDEEVRICYIPDIQGWLLENCPFPWVQERLKDNIEIQDMIGAICRIP